MRWIPYVITVAMVLPWMVCAIMGVHFDDSITALMTGTAILASAFMLSWACEVAEMDVPQALAISVLALVAVLPEYAVDATFAWKAASDPQQASYAIANMTGGNRLLLGLGWPLIVFLVWFRTREREVVLPKDMGVEVTVLMAATMYAFVPVWRGSLTLLDTGVYVTLYLLYLVAGVRSGGDEDEEEELVGPALALGALGTTPRRLGVIALLLFAGAGIFVSAEPFAESLVHTGKHFGVDEFLLVQWVAPLASESPEAVVAVLLVLRGHASKGMRTLVSSKVNQWTLLVGTLSVVMSIAAGKASALPLDPRQQEEVFLTAAQSLFGIAVLADLRFQLWQAFALVALFAVQVVFAHSHNWVAGAYIVLFFAVIAADPHSRQGIVRCVKTFIDVLLGRGIQPDAESEGAKAH